MRCLQLHGVNAPPLTIFVSLPRPLVFLQVQEDFIAHPVLSLMYKFGEAGVRHAVPKDPRGDCT